MAKASGKLPTDLRRIDKLTDAQRARFDEWADKWIEIGLRTGPADRPRFEASVTDCYRYAGLEPPKRIVWTTSPLVVALAGPIASYLLSGAVDGAVRGAVSDAVDGAVDGAVRGAVSGAVDGAVRGAVSGAVSDAVRGAVSDAVGGAVSDAVDGAVSGAVRGAVRGAVSDAVSDAVDGAVRGAVGGAVSGAVSDAVGSAVSDAVGSAWTYYMGGQFWVGGWYWGGSWTSYFREVCGLKLDGDLWDRARAYEATIESACWWWPHRDFVIVCERPLVIHREQVSPRGWRSHRLHAIDGPAVVWPDGWGVWAVHGVRVTEQVVMAPETLTVTQITAEPNAEVRRIMMERYGWERFAADAGAKQIDRDDWGTLWELPGGPRVVEVINNSPEPDGEYKHYWLAVSGENRTALDAIASTWRRRDNPRARLTGAQYASMVAVQT